LAILAEDRCRPPVPDFPWRARLPFVTFLRETSYWTVELDFASIGDAYTRLDARTSLTFKF
jgi:hypothetical protein